MTTNLELAKAYEAYIIGKRRWFHAHPELTGCESETVRCILDELKAMEIDCLEIENGGVLGWIRGADGNGTSVLLRADVDALPVSETDDNLVAGGRTCKSLHPGIMHACGHDGHIAMLLGAVRILSERRSEIRGTVYFIFERGEEYADNYRFILKYLDEHGIHPDTCWGIHLLAELDAGKFSILEGPVMASSIPFTVTIHGRGGHGSRPDQAINPIDAFCAVYDALSSYRLRRVSPFAGFTVSVGKLLAGEMGNVIPDTLTFQGSARTLDREGCGMAFYNEFEPLVASLCSTYGCSADIRIAKPGYPVINHPGCTALAKRAVANDLGEACLGNAEPWLATDSFGNYLKLMPGVYAFLGIRNPEKGCGAAHHSSAFDLDESVLYLGAAATAAYALEFLKSPIDTGSEKTFSSYRALLTAKGDRKRLHELYGE